MPILGAILVIIAAMLFYEGLHLYLQQPLVKEKLAEYSMVDAERLAQRKTYFQRRIRPLARRIAPWFRFMRPLIFRGNVRAKLAYAGYPQNLTEDEMFGLQILSSAAVFVAAFFIIIIIQGELTATGIAFLIVLTILGLFLPLFWLDSEASKRQREVALAVPDLLDTLTICVRAGLGFDQSLHYIVQRMKGPLAEEVETFLNELTMGLPRAECFRRLRHRNSTSELHIVLDALVQAQELGVPIAKTLEEQAGDMRIRRIQRAREEGAKASPKISLITTILVAPAVMCLFVSLILCKMLPAMSAVLGG
jgi:tight adherence protein C